MSPRREWVSLRIRLLSRFPPPHVSRTSVKLFHVHIHCFILYMEKKKLIKCFYSMLIQLLYTESAVHWTSVSLANIPDWKYVWTADCTERPKEPSPLTSLCGTLFIPLSINAPWRHKWTETTQIKCHLNLHNCWASTMNPQQETGFGRQPTCNRKWERISYKLSHVLWQDLLERSGKTISEERSSEIFAISNWFKC